MQLAESIDSLAAILTTTFTPLNHLRAVDDEAFYDAQENILATDYQY